MVDLRVPWISVISKERGTWRRSVGQLIRSVGKPLIEEMTLRSLTSVLVAILSEMLQELMI